MRKAVAIVAVLAVVGFVYGQGTVEIFLTKASMDEPCPGLTKPDKAFDPTGHEYDGAEWDGYDLSDWLDGYGVPYALCEPHPPCPEPPTEPLYIDADAGEWGYIWIRLTQVVKNKKIQGLHMGWIEPNSPLVDEVAYYVCNDLNGSVGAKRWDGVYVMEEEPEFKSNPQNLAAVTAAGIKNTDSAPYPPMLQCFYGNEVSGGVPPVVKADSIWLLGAVRFHWEEGMSPYEACPFLGELGLAFEAGYQPDQVILHCATIVPEPAAILLLGVGALLIRRR